MKCPVDNIDLVMSERSGVEIDYCPTCRGVWLDRGELDKILDRAAALAGPERPHAPSAPPVAPPLPSPLLNRAPRPSERDHGRYDDSRDHRFERDNRRGDDYRGYEGRGYDPRGQKPYRKKKDNWLGEMFDF
ncbi:hypothetical protein BJ994_003199 [Arthrobacter pigmenti]|uniref:Transcription factor zinc-finger domain-containing protein n=1 Tax=Arthrobacter pigmenti TaxID=271432 RepID=A0A846RLM3_9MICC|nr:zf-TFIIB domain-containing protein [Arthrobacter pigmenti]NJC24123.1 hypothetical protein [Arthrobacter pigmenti]